MESKTILIAYTDDLWVKSVCTLFQEMGCRVEMTQALSGMIRKVRNGNTHVILLDDELEGVKAYDLVPLLKKINLKIPVIAVSSQKSLDWVKRLRGPGIFYQAMKPVDLEEIGAAVRCAFEKAKRENLKEELFAFLMPEDIPVFSSP